MRILRDLFLTSIVLSLVLHGLIGASLVFWKDKGPDTNEEKVLVVEYLDENPRDQGQIVDQNVKPLNDEIPEHTKFLSRNNQRVERETKAERRGEFKNQAAQGRAPLMPTASQAEQKQKSKSMVSSTEGLPSLQALKPQMDWEKLSEKNQTRSVQVAGDPAQTDDHLKEVETGAQTVLNTKEFMYFTYYARIKKQIQQYWEPMIKEKVKNIFLQGRQLASVDRTTRLLIVLNKEGTLVAVKVLGQSGEYDLDQAAIDAFKAAAPFPNPPEGLVEGDETVKIRWDFILEA
jgi:protein TonB